MDGLRIISTGHYAPDRVVTNDDLSKIVDTSDEWITERTGIKRRHFCNDDEGNVSMAVKAATVALEKIDIDISEIGCLVVSTFSGD